MISNRIKCFAAALCVALFSHVYGIDYFLHGAGAWSGSADATTPATPVVYSSSEVGANSIYLGNTSNFSSQYAVTSLANSTQYLATISNTSTMTGSVNTYFAGGGANQLLKVGSFLQNSAVNYTFRRQSGATSSNVETKTITVNNGYLGIGNDSNQALTKLTVTGETSISGSNSRLIVYADVVDFQGAINLSNRGMLNVYVDQNAFIASPKSLWSEFTAVSINAQGSSSVNLGDVKTGTTTITKNNLKSINITGNFTANSDGGANALVNMYAKDSITIGGTLSLSGANSITTKIGSDYGATLSLGALSVSQTDNLNTLAIGTLASAIKSFSADSASFASNGGKIDSSIYFEESFATTGDVTFTGTSQLTSNILTTANGTVSMKDLKINAVNGTSSVINFGSAANALKTFNAQNMSLTNNTSTNLTTTIYATDTITLTGTLTLNNAATSGSPRTYFLGGAAMTLGNLDITSSSPQEVYFGNTDNALKSLSITNLKYIIDSTYKSATININTTDGATIGSYNLDVQYTSGSNATMLFTKVYGGDLNIGTISHIEGSTIKKNRFEWQNATNQSALNITSVTASMQDWYVFGGSSSDHFKDIKITTLNMNEASVYLRAASTIDIGSLNITGGDGTNRSYIEARYATTNKIGSLTVDAGFRFYMNMSGTAVAPTFGEINLNGAGLNIEALKVGDKPKVTGNFTVSNDGKAAVSFNTNISGDITTATGVDIGGNLVVNGAILFDEGSASGKSFDVKMSALVCGNTDNMFRITTSYGTTGTASNTNLVIKGTVAGKYEYCGRLHDVGETTPTAQYMSYPGSKIGVIMEAAEGVSQYLLGANYYRGDTIIKSGNLFVTTLNGSQKGENERFNGSLYLSKVILQGGGFGAVGTATGGTNYTYSEVGEVRATTMEWSGGSVLVDVASASSYDKIILSGDFLHIGDGELIVDLNFMGSYEITDTDVYSVIAWAGVSDVSADKIVVKNNKGFDLMAKIVGNTLQISVIPEPSTYAAIFGVMALLFVLIRRKKKSL